MFSFVSVGFAELDEEDESALAFGTDFSEWSEKSEVGGALPHEHGMNDDEEQNNGNVEQNPENSGLTEGVPD